jgi:hypothetical protein
MAKNKRELSVTTIPNEHQPTDFDKALDTLDGMLKDKDLPNPVEWQIRLREENNPTTTKDFAQFVRTIDPLD